MVVFGGGSELLNTCVVKTGTVSDLLILVFLQQQPSGFHATDQCCWLQCLLLLGAVKKHLFTILTQILTTQHFHSKSAITHSLLLFDVFNRGLQSSGPLCGFILHSLHRLQQGRYIGHHHLQQPGHIIWRQIRLKARTYCSLIKEILILLSTYTSSCGK